MIGLDSKVLVRYLADDDAVQSPIARRLVERELSSRQPGFVSLPTLVEFLWVMRRHHAATADELVDLTEALLCDDRFLVQHAAAAWRALGASKDQGVDLPDALIAYVNEAEGCEYTVTFDRVATRMRPMRLLGSKP